MRASKNLEFHAILNEIIMDTDNEIGRLCSGNDISRTRKRINHLIAKRRVECKLKLTEGSYTPKEYLNAITHTIGKVNAVNTEYSDESVEEESIETTNQNNCVVCLTIRITTWVCVSCSDMMNFQLHSEELPLLESMFEMLRLLLHQL